MYRHVYVLTPSAFKASLTVVAFSVPVCEHRCPWVLTRGCSSWVINSSMWPPLQNIGTWRVEGGKCDTKPQRRLWRTRGLQTLCLYSANTELLIGLEPRDTWINAIYLRRVNIASAKPCLKQTSQGSLKGSTKMWIMVI